MFKGPVCSVDKLLQVLKLKSLIHSSSLPMIIIWIFNTIYLNCLPVCDVSNNSAGFHNDLYLVVYFQMTGVQYLETQPSLVLDSFPYCLIFCSLCNTTACTETTNPMTRWWTTVMRKML